MTSTEPRDWTNGPAKFVAAVVLGGASIAGLTWSISTRAPASARAGVPLVQGVESAGSSAELAGEVGRERSAERSSSIVRMINLNTASAEELELLPGIGPALAARIVAFRDSHGQFRSINDLDRVSGIGPRTIERLRDKVTVE